MKIEIEFFPVSESSLPVSREFLALVDAPWPVGSRIQFTRVFRGDELGPIDLSSGEITEFQPFITHWAYLPKL